MGIVILTGRLEVARSIHHETEREVIVARLDFLFVEEEEEEEEEEDVKDLDAVVEELEAIEVND